MRIVPVSVGHGEAFRGAMVVLVAVALAGGMLWTVGLRPAIAENPTGSLPQAIHEGRAGIYYRVARRDPGLNVDHPLIDAVIVRAPWAELEPRQGDFQFEKLLKTIEVWGEAGKGVVVHTPLYGQATDDSITPSWVYDAGVRGISFRGGGRAKGARVTIPAVWESNFVKQRMAPLLSALAAAVSNNPYVWYVMPAVGHIGNLNAQPSKDGGRALKEAGWTVEKWTDYVARVIDTYQKHFPSTPLLIKSAPRLLRDRKREHYAKQADDLLASVGKRGAAVISLGLSPEAQDIRRMLDRLAPLAETARSGDTRLGVGDDWPLWVPPARRQAGPTRGRDEQALADMTRQVFGEAGVPRLPVTILFCQEPEISASNPKHPKYSPEVEAAIREIRQRLFVNERAIFEQRNRL